MEYVGPDADPHRKSPGYVFIYLHCHFDILYAWEPLSLCYKILIDPSP